MRAARLCLHIEISSFHPYLLTQANQPNPSASPRVKRTKPRPAPHPPALPSTQHLHASKTDELFPIYINLSTSRPQLQPSSPPTTPNTTQYPCIPDYIPLYPTSTTNNTYPTHETVANTASYLSIYIYQASLVITLLDTLAAPAPVSTSA
jgi:hypothetical protein